MVQGWITHQASRLTYKTYAYKWLNPNKDGTYKSNHINSLIGWQLLAINKLENHLNAYSGISTVKIKMMAKKFITKELIIRINKMRRLKALLAHKSPKLNPYYKINHGLYSLLQKMTDLETSICFHKKYSEVIVF